MTFIKQIPNGDWYIHKAKGHTGHTMGRKTDITKMSNIFLIKAKGGDSLCGDVTLGHLILPQEFIGKRLRFKVEVEDD